MKTIYKALHLFCGIGGGSLGFSQARGEYRGLVGQVENILGIDADSEICQDYARITGSPVACMDLFSREQYIDFHGCEPPSEWQEITPDDILKATGGISPDIVFTSPPCKGFSGLLPEKSAKTKKYQALNKLTIRGIKLVIEAFEDDLPSLILLENVPRITTRGKRLLDEIKSVLHKAGYATNDESHDCGEIGGLAQHRKRYLLIARNEKKCGSFVYRPEIRNLKTIGDVIGPLPLPGDPACGPLHRMPKLQWKTWMRLALIPAGGDWRDLEKLDWKNYRITYEPRNGAMSISDWNDVAGAVTGAQGFGRSNSTQAVADPRLNDRDSRHPGVYQIVKWEETGPCVTGTRFGSGAPAISDPRTGFKDSTHGAIYRVQQWDDAGHTVTGAMRPNNGSPCIADPRLQHQKVRYTNKFQLHGWEETAATVTGTHDIQAGAPSIADPRIGCSPRAGTYGVMQWDEPAKTVIASGDVHAGAAAIADPRLNSRKNRRSNSYTVRSWDDQSHTITGEDTIGSGAQSVADPRIPEDHESGVFVIVALDGTWHRPLTTFELAMLQGFPAYLADGTQFELTGNSDAKCRERIGNAVPPAAARAIAEVMLAALMPSSEGVWVMGSTDIWVTPGDEKEVELIH